MNFIELFCGKHCLFKASYWSKILQWVHLNHTARSFTFSHLPVGLFSRRLAQILCSSTLMVLVAFYPFSFAFLRLRICSIQPARWSVNVKQIKALLPRELLKCCILNVTFFFLIDSSKVEIRSVNEQTWGFRETKTQHSSFCSACAFMCLTFGRFEHLLVLMQIITTGTVQM